MNYITTYLNRVCQQTMEVSLNIYREHLDQKLKSIERYINYLVQKRDYIGKMIDSLALRLENKYIDMIEEEYIDCAEEIEHDDIEAIKQKLNVMEADYARIETDLSLQAKEKINTETECDLIERISLVA